MFQWLRSYRLMLQWQALSNKPMLPIYLVIEAMIAIGFVIGVGFLIPDIDPSSAKLLSTGVPTLILLSVGLVVVPHMVATAKTEGTFDYMWSLPVPRMAYLMADATIWLLVSLPGVVLALVIGSVYYDFDLQVSPLVVPAFLLAALTGIFVGYAIAHVSPKPQLTILLTQFFIFAILIFSPIHYPIEQLPGWLAELHRFLPMKYMADITRGTVTEGEVGGLGLAFTAVGAWCVIGFAITYAVVRRRR